LNEPGCPSENAIRIEPSGVPAYFAYGRTRRVPPPSWRLGEGLLTSVCGAIQWRPSAVEVKYGAQQGPRMNR
jgi:hypothetical protein